MRPSKEPLVDRRVEVDALNHLAEGERVTRDAGRFAGATPRIIDRVGVIGAGTMGRGIAMSLANAGLQVTLVDADQGALAAGLASIYSSYASSQAKGKISLEEAVQRRARISGSLKLEELAASDLVIEAVFESMPLKKEIFAKLDEFAKPGAILASNTSTLDINEIAASTRRPQDVVGAHFFSPAHVMKLLEIVRGERTAPDVLTTLIKLCERIGKIGVIVGVCDGFVGNRMIHQYFREAEFLLAEGASPTDVDGALTTFGLPMGPFAMSDMAGNDLRATVERQRASHRAPGERYSELLMKLAAAGRFGQKSGIGWYRYQPGSRTPIADPELDNLFQAEADRLGIQRAPVPAEEIIKRCLYGLVNEAAFILEEGVADRGSDIDVIYVRAYGFPQSHGGPLYWADQIGLNSIVADIERFRKSFGSHWRLAPLLARLATTGERLSSYTNVEVTSTD